MSDCLFVANVCYYSTTHLHLLVLSCRWQWSRRMRTHWTVLRRSNQASALNSEEPGREGGLRLALVERENWGSFRLHFLLIWTVFFPFLQRLRVRLICKRDPLQHYSIFPDLHKHRMSKYFKNMICYCY